MTWFPFSLTATLIFGVAMALYKLPSAKGHDRFATTFWSLLVPALLSVIFFHSYLGLGTTSLILVSALWGATFTCIVLLQMYALKHVDTNTLFPVTTTASLVLTVLIGIFAFSEFPTIIQGLGICLAILTIFLFVYKGGKLEYSPLILGVGSGVVAISAFNKVLQKIVADSFDIHVFQIYQYAFAALFALVIYSFIHRRDWKEHIVSGGLGIGSLIGLFSFFGGYTLYIALTKGPFPLITSIHSLYTFVTALVAYFLFKENLTTKKIALLVLAIIAVVLIRLG